MFDTEAPDVATAQDRRPVTCGTGGGAPSATPTGRSRERQRCTPRQLFGWLASRRYRGAAIASSLCDFEIPAVFEVVTALGLPASPRKCRARECYTQAARLAGSRPNRHGIQTFR